MRFQPDSGTGGRLPVRWVSFIYDTFGYADEARNMVLRLNEEKFRIKVYPVCKQQDELKILDDNTRKKLDLLVRREEQLNPVNIIWLPVNWITNTRGIQIPNSSANIIRTMFETDRIPADWVTTCNNMNEIWVPSQFNVETFAQAGVSRDKLFVIPGGIDPDKFSSDVAPANWPDKRGFNFLSVFEWTDRKGWDVLVRAYLKEFKKKDDVALVLKVNVPGVDSTVKIQHQIFDCIRSVGLNPENIPAIALIHKNFTGREMAALYAACDAFVLPSRGEGWGRPYMEAMAMGLPTIGTRWSGQLEFMHDDNSYLIDLDGLEDIPPTIDTPIFKGHRWARPSLEHTMVLMRRVYENREQAREKGSQARREVIQKWSWEKAAEKVEQRLDSYRR